MVYLTEPSFPEVVCAPDLDASARALLNRYVLRQVGESLLHQMPSWFEVRRGIVVGMKSRATQRIDSAGHVHDGLEAQITARVFGEAGNHSLFPVFAMLLHWDDGTSTGTVLQDVFARSRSGLTRIPVALGGQRALGSAAASVFREQHWESVDRAWSDLQTGQGLDSRSDPPGR